jgi:hypothetical protein
MIIDVDRLASRQGRRRSSNEGATQYYKSSADVDAAVDPEGATADAADYDDDNSDPIIYVSNNHSLHSMSTLGTMGLFTAQYGNEGSAKKEGKSFTTNQGGEHHTEQSIELLDRAINERSMKDLSISTLGTMGFKEIRVKKTVDPFTASEHPLDHGAISTEGRSAKEPPSPRPPLEQPLTRQTNTPLTDQTHRLRSSSSSSSSSAKHPGEGSPAVTHDSQREESSWHDRKAFQHNLKALKQVPPQPPPPPSKLPLTRRASAPIEWQQQQQQRSTLTRTKKKLSPIPQSPYVVEGESTPSESSRRDVSSPKPPPAPPLSSSPPAPRKMIDIDIHLTAKSSGKTRVHTGLMPPLPIKAPPRHHATTRASCRAVSSSENKHVGSLLETNLRKKVVAVRRDTTVNGNLGKSWPVGGRSHQEQQHQLMMDYDEINLSRVAIRQDTVDYENFSKSWPAGGGGGRPPTGDRSQQWQYQKKKKKKDDELLNKVMVGYYQHDREKECPPPPPPPPHRAQSPHSVTCAISSPVVSPTDSEVAAKQQIENTNRPSRDGGSSKNIRQDKMKLPPLPFSSNARPMQMSSSTMQTQKTQRDFNITLMKLQHQVELSKRTNGLAARQYHARHFWFYSVPISTCLIMSMILVMMCAINGIDTDVRIGLAMGSVFCSILAFVFYYLAGKVGMTHHAALHTTARNEMTKAGFRLDQLSKYKGCGLVSGLHSTKACTNAIRTLHRLDVYIRAINQCTPAIPKGIINVYRLLTNRINRICRTCPNAIEKSLSYVMDDNNCDSADHATTAPIDLKTDAYTCLEEELWRFLLYPVFMPNAEDVVSRTIDIFFEDTTDVNSSCKNTELNSLM